MSIEESRCNVELKQEVLSSNERLLTYRRRKRARNGFSADEEAMKELRHIMLCTTNCGQGDISRRNSHWRNVLEHMLQLPDVCEGGGIESSISDALTHGPPADNRESNMADVRADITDSKDRHKSHFGVTCQSIRMDVSEYTLVNVSETGTYDPTNAIADKQKCQDAFFNILCSEKFASLCNLLCESFQVIKVDKLFDISQINSNMKNGVYDQSPGLFSEDLQQLWRKFRKIGEEMVLLASCLSNMSQGVHQKQENCQVEAITKNSNGSNTMIQLPSCESVPSTKPNQTEVSVLYKACTCKQCGNEADAKHSLICDECEAVYHFSCVKPTVQEIPTKSWYCTFCSQKTKQSSSENTQENGLHNSNCAVCERLEIPEPKENLNESIGESSDSSLESDEPPEPSRTALSRLCKQCGTCEDDDKRFLICGHSQCPYKFYHIRCLTTTQMASLQQKGQDCWYCPSCLCRACFHNKDDDKIVLCDNCDEAYHIYCMKPPRASIPNGQWYCLKCNIAKAKEGMKRYEQWVLQQHGKKNGRQANEENRHVDMILKVVDELNSEEKSAARRKK
ncbi:PHD finger protein EHD3-like isoform X2 [Asparagus officinalis]|uniref:PHD finger protein EHD3-like isoform X2 n=1 Tax=Asparagus officinalis TaxID=4686 RepID=UPI00098E2352|nr:PHD finger protein EHD3-like isoform X2 [Asparagus officinalis]